MSVVARGWQRAEGLALLLAGAAAAWWLGPPPWLAAAAALAPDLSFLGYLGGPRVGAAVYNLAHALVAPVALALVLAAAGAPPAALAVAALWVAHIGFDRGLGYGLKGRSFGETHLGPIGRGEG